MYDWSIGKRIAYGALQAAGLGFLAAGLESVALAATLTLPLGFVGLALVGLVNLAVMGLVAGLVGLAVGAPLHASRREGRTADHLSVHMGLVTTVLCCWFIWQGAADVAAAGRTGGAVVMAVMPLLFGVVIYFNSRYWLRRVELEVEVPAPWLVVALAGGLIMVLGSAAAHSSRNLGGSRALEGDPNLVLIAIDGLRADAVPKRIAGVGDGGWTYQQAVTSSPAAGPAVASVLTGLHPLRHQVIADGATLPRGQVTLAELLSDEGYATGGFVSTDALAGSTGIGQGFLTWDDHVSGPLPGLDRLNILGMVLGGSGTRPSAGTTAAFLHWLDRVDLVPFMALVHLPGPDPTGDYDQWVASTDAQVGDILDQLDERGISATTMVVVMGTHGWMRGEYGHGSGVVGLYDPVVHVPLVIRKPGVQPDQPVVEPQVRLMDVMPTALAWHKLDPRDESEGIDLKLFEAGTMGSLSATLLGAGPDGEPQLGLRNNGVKVLMGLSDGQLHMYDLSAGEQADISSKQPELLLRAKGYLSGERAAYQRIVDGR